MAKDFDTWNELKKNIDSRDVGVFCNPREVWWASIGLNIGSEEDGKNELFERPVLVVKVFNQRAIRVVPLTSKTKSDQNHVPVGYLGAKSSAILSQAKTISTKRLTRKIGRVEIEAFNLVINRLRESLA